MAEFICKKCKTKKNILKQTFVFEKKILRVKEALCQCGKYMEDTTKYNGFGTSFKAENDKIN